MNIAIIPARGGSRRIPQKNIKHFAGQPIIAYPIKAALTSGCFDHVMVSTDNEQIARIARDYGASTPFYRTSGTANDVASLHDVVLETLTGLSNLNHVIEQVAVILPTTPMLNVNTIKNVMRFVDHPEYDSAITVTEYAVSPQRALSLSPDGTIIKHHNVQPGIRSQEQPKYLHDAGQMYAFHAADVSQRNTLSGAKCQAIILDYMQCQDIDTDDDWAIAEFKYMKRLGHLTDEALQLI